jgi:hypothetical protein
MLYEFVRCTANCLLNDYKVPQIYFWCMEHSLSLLLLFQYISDYWLFVCLEWCVVVEMVTNCFIHNI